MYLEQLMLSSSDKTMVFLLVVIVLISCSRQLNRFHLFNYLPWSICVPSATVVAFWRTSTLSSSNKTSWSDSEHSFATWNWKFPPWYPNPLPQSKIESPSCHFWCFSTFFYAYRHQFVNWFSISYTFPILSSSDQKSKYWSTSSNLAGGLWLPADCLAELTMR